MANELGGHPAYTGVTCHVDKTGGYAVWLPSDWHESKLKRNHRGFLFSPYPDTLDTSILIEKRKLKVTVTMEDMLTLRNAFKEDIEALPGVEIEKFEESFADRINILDARFTFLEGENLRKRWIRNIYWGNGQLFVIAQGRTPEDFEYWLPMFYNTMMTIELV